MSIEKYVGRLVQIIYQDRKEQITQRVVRIHSVAVNKVKAFDTDKKAFRVFDIDHILAFHPMRWTA